MEAVYLDVVDHEVLRAAVSERSYRKVAAAAGVSLGFLHNLCKGENKQVNATFATAIEDTLGRPRGSLFSIPPDKAAIIRPYLGCNGSAA